MGHCSPVPSADASTTLTTECQARGMGTSGGESGFSGRLKSLIVVVNSSVNSIPVLQPILFDLKSKCISFQAQLLRLDTGVSS